VRRTPCVPQFAIEEDAITIDEDQEGGIHEAHDPHRRTVLKLFDSHGGLNFLFNGVDAKVMYVISSMTKY
jgi:hypothetical protein